MRGGNLDAPAQSRRVEAVVDPRVEVVLELALEPEALDRVPLHGLRQRGGAEQGACQRMAAQVLERDGMLAGADRVMAGIDPDPRSGPVTMNPDKVLEIEELTVAPREAEFSVAFEGTHYSINRFPISGGMVPSWNQEAFAVLANLFQMTVTDVSNAKAPIISISKGS